MLGRFNTVFLLISAVVTGAAPGLAQAPQEKIDTAVIDKIKEEGMKHSQVMDLLSYITDVYGPRLTGSPNIKAAQEWAKQKLTEWGMQNAHLEAWGPFGRGWTIEGFSANVIKPRFSSLIAYPKAWTPSTSGTVRGQAVYLDGKTDADLEQYRGKLKGAIVLISPPREIKAHFKAEAQRLSDEDLLKLANYDPNTPITTSRFQMTPEQRAAADLQNKKWQLAASEGAAVVLEPGRGDGGTVFVQSATMPAPVDTPYDRRPHPWSKDATGVVPQAAIAAEHYNRIIRTITKGIPVEMEVSITSRFYDQDLMSYNVIAEIPGTDLKDEVVMLGAHYDSWHSGTGATDNGAGSAVCLEAVRIIKSLGLQPRRTIRIGLWSGEEQGLLGSRAYVEQHLGKRVIEQQAESPASGAGRRGEPLVFHVEVKPEHEKFAAYFNLDNGTGKVRGVYMQGNEGVRPIFRTWLEPFRELGAATLSISNTGGTDHQSFDGIGLPGFQFIQDEVEYETRTHHSNMDVFDRIQDEDMRQAATILAAFVYNAAMRDQKLPRKPLPERAAGQASR